MKGLIFDIQRFSVHDGPGIRTTVFLKGCNLRCLWCHNPESINPFPELQRYLYKCIGCGQCIKVCPNEATKNREKCLNCGRCTKECFSGARVLAGSYMSLEEVLEVVERDKGFYIETQGGVTFSGGEPLLQKDFLREILKSSKNHGINTAVDTAGNIPWESIEEILPYTDLFLYDLKVMDEIKHKEVTGVSNKIILSNLKELSNRTSEIIIRIPVIPGINNSLKNMQATYNFLKELKGIKAVELIPFHKLGEGKYESLGIEYPAKDFRLLEKGEIEKLGIIFSGLTT